MITIEKSKIIEEIRDLNFILVEAMMNDDKGEIEKTRILINSVIKLYLKVEGNA